MNLDFVIDKIAQSTEELVSAIKDEIKLPALGLRRSARLPVMAALYQQLHYPLVLLTDRADHALTLADELILWLPDAPRLYFPEPNPLFYEDAAWGETTRRDRLLALTALANYHVPGASVSPQPPIIIAPIRAVMTRTLPRRDFLKASRTMKRGQVVHLEELARHWIRLGYEAVNTVIGPGEFARRGGILDIWPPADTFPTRIEFFGDEIETLHHFDPATQRTIRGNRNPLQENLAQPQNIDRILITPAREYLRSDQLPPELETIEKSQGSLDLSEFYIPILHPIPGSLIDFLPRPAVILIDDVSALQDYVNEIEEQAVGVREDYIADGTLPADFPIPYLTWPEILDSLSMHQVLELGPVFSDQEEGLAQKFSAGPRFGGRLKPAMDHMAERYTAGDQLVIVSRQTARLIELWDEARLELPTDTPISELPAPVFIEGSLAEGWVYTSQDQRGYHLLTDGEIFGWRRPEPRQRHRPIAEAPEAAYADLQVGSLVVHVDHGIGIFQGLVRRTVEDNEREYLCIEYAENDQLFVPVYQADRLTRYIGPDNRVPSLSRLGSPEWRNTKSRAKEAVEEIAEDLLELYAKRQIVEGFPFEADTPWQKELEGSFPYVETEDQLRVISEVKKDMEEERPMDRLICGDVGYGKTEVALRAAFKAVMSGKQVAVLVPTTVLAQQHYNTFRERLAPFSVEVEMLSRFRTHHQQQEILERLAKGGIDIVIGTHRLIQSDVHFKELGLLVIDEEQRFGVTHKETLKKLRTEVDVLTLTATPIPRTLYMALTGVRDISTINTPPEERLPIITHVGPYSQRLIRQAILRELERGGQVFFVHNRVQTIGAMHRHLEKLVPEARISVAHGQMPENELSVRMEQFTNGEVDILLSTSIIESGLDIPNANTLIVDRADTFGLAQLYQLRGRVGRGAQRAYAYFFRHRRKPPSLEGRQRLETIAENTQLGAGYSIAMRDLEIRGAGDILGTRQHGQIAAVGFHLYTRLLADAVFHLRTNSPITSIPMPVQEGRMPVELLTSIDPQRPIVSVDLPLPVNIPADYVSDTDIRLRLYRRIASLRSLAEIDALESEFVDRFGLLPEAVKNLLFQMKVKLLAEEIPLVSVSAENGQIVLRFPPLPEGVTHRTFPYLGLEVRSGKNALWIQGTIPNWPEILMNVLAEIGESKVMTQ